MCICVFNIIGVGWGLQLRQGPLPGEQLRAKVFGVIVWICQSLQDLLRGEG